MVVYAWSDTDFYVYPVQGGVDDAFQVIPLNIMLHEHEMQEWARAPHGMDKMYEPDLMRPGKFKSTSARRA